MILDDKDPTQAAEGAPAETPAQAPAPAEAPAQPALEVELAELKDKYLRLAAEFDNFRKRAQRDRAEIWLRAQADLVQRLVDALDDLARFARVDLATTDAKMIHDGVDLVARKVWKELEAAGVQRIDQVGVPFDPNLHEAVATVPAPSAELDHTVAAILQAGYRLGSTLIRPARVSVQVWTDSAKPADA
ncbi:MAG TPA: nucleotide exchange factor GrpE [Gemmatimonadales bacterium]|nr:nucleotide exchange factor GrpE [Gemmatimonadales bacterium]